MSDALDRAIRAVWRNHRGHFLGVLAGALAGIGAGMAMPYLYPHIPYPDPLLGFQTGIIMIVAGAGITFIVIVRTFLDAL